MENGRGEVGGSERVTRRSVLAAGGALGVAGLAGCTDTIEGLIGEAAAGAVTNTHATPAAFYGGERQPDGSRAESKYTVEHVPITISGEYEGLESSVDLSAYVTSSQVRAQNHNSSRSNRTRGIHDPDSDDDGLDDGSELFAYLDGEATIGERFILTVPDARLGEDGASLLDELTPQRLLEYLAGGDTEGNDIILRKRPGLAAGIEWPFPTGTGPYNPNEQLLALGYKGDINNATVGLNVRTDGDIDTDDDGDDGEEGVYLSNGTLSRANGGGLHAWGDNRIAGESNVSPTAILPVAAQPEDCPEPMPALLYVRRIRRDDQYIFAGGWIVDDNALYHNAVTMLVAEEVPEISTVDHDRSVEEMRRSITSGLTRERSRLGSLAYDDELNERTLSFLPPYQREDAGREELIREARAIVGGRNPQTGKEIQIALANGSVDADAESLQATVVPLDNPIVHISLAADCKDCEECKCTTNLVPAVNNISSR